MHQRTADCSFADLMPLPGFIHRPDLGAVAATVVVKAPVAADKEQRTGMTKRAGKLVEPLGDVHATSVIKLAASRHQQFFREILDALDLRPDWAGWAMTNV